MDEKKIIESLLKNANSAFGLHKIITDDSGNPCDYVFIKINRKFEDFTGLKEADIINKKVTEVLPNIINSDFDWIAKYGEVASNGEPIEFEAFSESLNRWYSVKAFSPEKGYFITVFDELTKFKSKEILSELQNQNYEYSTLNMAITELSKMKTKEEVYQYLINFIFELVPDSIILSLEKLEGDYLKLVEVKGLEKNIIKKVVDLMGFDVLSKKYKIIPEFKDIFAKNRLYEHKEGLGKFALSEIPRTISIAVQKMLGIKSIYTIGLVSDNKHIGNFHIFLRKDNKFNVHLLENLFYQSALVVERINENLKNVELLKNFRTFYNNLQDFVFVIDKNGEIKYANLYAKEHLGYDFDKLRSMNITSLCGNNDSKKFGEIIKAQTEQVYTGKKCTFISDKGLEIPIEVSVLKGSWYDEEVFYFIGKDLRAIQASENKFKLAFRNNPSPMSISELDNGVFVDVNDAFLRTLKCKREDIIGKSLLKLDIFVSLQELINIVQKIRKQKSISNFRLDFKTFDSELRTCLLFSDIIAINNKEHMVSTFVDITERILLENKIEKINKTLIEENNLFQNGPVVLIRWKNHDNYKIESVSENIKELTGFTQDEFLEQNISINDIIHYLDREKIIDEIDNAKNDKSQTYISHTDFRINSKDETTKWVSLFTLIIRNEAGEPVGFLGYAYEITNTKKTEEDLQILLRNYEWKNKELENTAKKLELQINEVLLIEKMLRESEEKFRSLSESAKDGIIILDSKSEVTYWNQAATNIFGYSSEEMKDMKLDKIFSSKSLLVEHNSKMKSFVKTGSGSLIGKTVELPAIYKNGSLIDIELSLSSVIIQNEWHAIGMVRDITERKKAEKKLAEMNDELTLSNLEKDKFFSIIAHDLKGPLGSLMGLSELVAEDIESIEKNEMVEIAQSFHESLTNIYKLLENLLDWSRLQRNTIQFAPENTNLKMLSKNTAMLLKAALSNKKINLKDDIPEDLDAFADGNMISTVIRNLISNAIKFTNPNGTITLTSNAEDNEKIIVTIADDGIGMDEEHQKNLFKIGKNYSRLGTENEPGTGLGLILCKEFIVKNGGDIWVESKEGIGTKFFFTLPKAKD